MSAIFELHAPNDPIRPFYQGRVHRAPVDLSDKMDVVVPSFDPDLVWRGCRWQARDLVTLPNVNDLVLVVLDDQTEPWVVCWWPF